MAETPKEIKVNVAATLPPTLAKKLSEVMGLMRGVKKEGFNKVQNYRFVRETDVAEKVSELLAERHIWIEQSLISVKRKPLYITQSQMTMWMTDVVVEFYFVDGETGETTPPRKFPGSGADTGDKGVYKAMTGAEKYFLMKSFLVSTGDDPEADEKVDKAQAATGAAQGPRVRRGAVSGAARGGHSDVATQAQVDEVARLAGKLRLNADTLSPIINATLGITPKDGETIRSFLSALTSDAIGKLIAALNEFEPIPEGSDGVVSDVNTSSTDVDEEAEPDNLTLV